VESARRYVDELQALAPPSPVDTTLP
jgi:hypothetical protein